ncbi:thiamine pyrophosphate-binding protein [Roseibacillus persicicus]|uniref:2-succinyl-5-enolpyruvyl-6-hydroxy-3-cyclohexene-1-carboxylate synthase n=1 Tax=Roseibacillus persicicus TaxID=454148 RepID=A0A918WIA2_9BACT|nr:thiamine pyrophosphate-binding protein [Roseibacillus persicicus]GHC46206.1 2-succinyl-5-enolpyruvyl-6-hydroxy-3-cyclohexene-1-carboxylate synthase [Roseibacillus persicicus]
MEIAKDLEELLARGVRQFVVCGGARNAPVLEWISRIEGAEVYSHFEERGAGFFALGRTMVTGEPCAVVVTSGTAVAELLPAVIEAFYQQRPLVVISADRPEHYRGTGAPQAIEQEGIFGDYAASRISFWEGKGPLHLNLPMEEDVDLGAPGLLEEFMLDRSSFNVAPLAQWLRKGVFKGLVVMVGGLDEQDREEVFYFCQNLGAPVLADAASGLREALGELQLVDGDRLLKANPPGKVLRIGQVPVGRFWRDLENLPEVEVFSITCSGFSGLARASEVIVGEPARVVKGLGEVDEVGDVLEHFPASRRRYSQCDELLEAHPDSEPALVRELSLYAGQADSVFLGNSLPIREWNDFAQWEFPVTLVRACRGANGVDGQLSAWLGATVEEGKAWGLFGDVTTLYDLAAPYLLGQVAQEERVLVVLNNDGGRIFDRLPRLGGMSEAARGWMTTPHGRILEQWAAMWGLAYHKISCREDVDCLENLEPGTSVVEVFPSAKQTEAFWADWKR